MNISIIGTGTWGTALAQVLTDNGHDVLLFGNRQEQIDDINNNHRNTSYFEDSIILSNKIKATTSLEEVIEFADTIILSVPTAAMREVLTNVSKLLTRPVTLINTAKGFDGDKNIRISELAREIIPEKYLFGFVSIVGPSHAEEVIVRDLTCVCSVSVNNDLAMKIAKLFSNDYFRVYTNNDEIGSEIGVAMKNAIAIASGILEGLHYGDNARAALCSRGLAEIVKFGVSEGGKAETYLGLTGLGDLIVTCYSFHSRNFMAGLEIGKNDSAIEFLSKNTKTVEGIKTIFVIKKLAENKHIELPIIFALYQIIFENCKPSNVIKSLMNRPLKSEK